MRLVLLTGMLSLCAGCGVDRILSARELAAIRWTRGVASAEERYFVARGRYCGSLDELAEEQASSFLRDGPKHSIVALRITPSGYEASAIPDLTNASSYAMRNFYIDETSVMRYGTSSGPAGKSSPELSAFRP